MLNPIAVALANLILNGLFTFEKVKQHFPDYKEEVASALRIFGAAHLIT